MAIGRVMHISLPIVTAMGILNLEGILLLLEQGRILTMLTVRNVIHVKSGVNGLAVKQTA